MRLGIFDRAVHGVGVAVSTWCGISRAQLRVAIGFGIAIWLMHLIQGTFLVSQPPMLPIPWFESRLVSLFLSDQIGALTLLLAIAIADRVTGRDPGHKWTYLSAVVIAAVAWVTVTTAIVHGTGLPLGWGPMRRTDPLMAQWVGYGFFEWLMLDGAATFIYLDAIRAGREQLRLRTAQTERMLTAKRLVESQLLAMQARVEPGFLFNTLAHVRSLYDTQVASAERMLDDLIRYLRAAMPHMRSTTSTVRQEIELAQAYLDIMRLGVRGQLVTDIHVAPDIVRCRLPPMMLLPMIDRVLARDPGSASTTIALRVDCDSPAGDVLRIHIACEAAGLLHQTEDASVASIRDRLVALYGDRHRLVVSGGAGLASHMTLEVPLEHVVSPEHAPAAVLGFHAAQ